MGGWHGRRAPDRYRQRAEVLSSPNPFRSSALLRFRLAEAGPVSLRLYDVNGRAVEALLEKTWHAAGDHALALPGRNLDPGIYFAELKAGAATHTLKLVRIR